MFLRSSRVVNDDSPDALTRLRRTDFGRDVCDALAHLHDLAYLQTHPLTRRMSAVLPGEGGQTGRVLRAVLLEAIEALRPTVPSASDSHALRGYQILRLRY